VPWLVCVVGDDIVWNGAPPPDVRSLEPAIRDFAVAADLTCVELVIASVDDRLCVVAVDHRPDIGRYDSSAQRAIVLGLTKALTAGRNEVPLAATCSQGVAT
jgi:hypothetical protein